jgi:hypothetical protein
LCGADIPSSIFHLLKIIAQRVSHACRINGSFPLF